MSSLPPPHPSLPRPPHAHLQHNERQPSFNPAHVQLEHSSYYNSHYAQAYNQYAPSTSSMVSQANVSMAYQNYPTQRTSIDTTTMPSWYQAGNQRCSQQGCTFAGSAKSVETHMMDRHLVYPPGWEKRRKKPDWDADPSLKGKPIPIQGTNIILDSPEVLQAWIAERKRRFPTSTKVEEKKRKLEEASARGQLDLSDIGLAHPKRRKVEQQDNRQNVRSNRGRTFQQPQARVQAQPANIVPDRPINSSKPPIPQKPGSCPSDDDDEEEEESDAPEIFSSKRPETEVVVDLGATSNEVISAPNPPSKHLPAKQAPQSRQRNPPRNPFAPRQTLLRNLLAPEIRITVSNLSQAIRFLVDNDFLRNVELKPGEAAEKNKIQVLTSSSDAV